MSKSHTSRTLEYLRNLGMVAEVVERWVPNPSHPAGGVRKDLFGIIDIIALGDRPGTTGIQSCGQAFAEHDRKILDSEMALKWLNKNNTLMLIGWRKVKLRRGGKAMRWMPRIKEYMISDFLE